MPTTRPAGAHEGGCVQVPHDCTSVEGDSQPDADAELDELLADERGDVRVVDQRVERCVDALLGSRVRRHGDAKESL
ncbi:MAG: hypothetical protein HC868_16050 [Sphingomonadales bacterium]|nr:hypothetical protein [Sphingomonadales bacterium]